MRCFTSRLQLTALQSWWLGMREQAVLVQASMPMHVPDHDSLHGQFYYGEEYLMKWHHATVHQRTSCAGSHYHSFLDNTFQKTFIKYDNDVEGLRLDGDFRCPGDVKECPPPTRAWLIKKEDDTWHYHTEDSLPQAYRDVSSREVDDFCPRTQLNKACEVVWTSIFPL